MSLYHVWLLLFAGVLFGGSLNFSAISCLFMVVMVCFSRKLSSFCGCRRYYVLVLVWCVCFPSTVYLFLLEGLRVVFCWVYFLYFSFGVLYAGVVGLVFGVFWVCFL